MITHGVRATFFVDVTQPRVATDPPARHAENSLAEFVADNWPFGPPYPALYYAKRATLSRAGETVGSGPGSDVFQRVEDAVGVTPRREARSKSDGCYRLALDADRALHGDASMDRSAASSTTLVPSPLDELIGRRGGIREAARRFRPQPYSDWAVGDMLSEQIGVALGSSIIARLQGGRDHGYVFARFAVATFKRRIADRITCSVDQAAAQILATATINPRFILVQGGPHESASTFWIQRHALMALDLEKSKYCEKPDIALRFSSSALARVFAAERLAQADFRNAHPGMGEQVTVSWWSPGG